MIKKLIWTIGLSCFFILLIFAVLQLWITLTTRAHIYSDIDAIPKTDFAVVLGTSRYLKNGKNNPFYSERINDAAQLYLQNKVRHIIVSGDNKNFNYNEPRMMAQDLIKKGVPQSAITYDFAGFRTLDSIIRAQKIFNLNHFTVVTQQFHCERAIFIANKNNSQINCLAVKNPNHSFDIQFREFFARLYTILDLYIFNTQPKFLGELESIQLESKNNN